MTKLTSWFVVSAAAVAAFAFPALSWGQADISPLDGYTPGQVLQGSPGGSIPVSSMEVYNPASGQMTINIPLVTVQGRGAVSAPLLVPVTSPVWEAVAVRYQYNCGQYGCTTGYGYIVQTTGWNPFPATVGQGGGSMVMRGSGDYCVNSAAWHQTLTRGTFTAPDGTQTEFIDTATSGAPENQGYSRGTAFVADNGSGAKFVSNSAIVDPTGCGVITGTPSGIMTLSNGSQYTISYGTVTQIEDSNGNITLFGASSITDNLGRTYNITPGSDSNGSYDAVTYAGFSNATRTIKVRYDYLHNHLYTGQTMKTYGQLWPSIPGPPSSGGPTNLTQNFDPIDIVSEIDLADGTKYQFEYDSYGDVRQIILPLGGVIQYSYSSYFTQTGGNPVTLYMMGQIPSQRSQLLSGNVISQMKFPGGGEIDRYDGNGNLLAKETHTITNTGTLPSYATNYNSYQYNQSSANTYYDSAANGGGVLESQTVSYFQTANCIVNCTTAQTVTTTMGTAVKQTGYSYDQYSNLTEQTDSDWSTSSPGGTLRDIRMTYNTASAYINANILSLPTETKIFDGGNNLYADTQIGYDAAGTNNNGTSISPVTLNGTYHDNNNYSGNATRGNATVSRVCQTASGGSCSAWLNYSYNTFDAAGNLVTAQDANGHSTTISYADNYNDISGQNTDALPTAITNAYGQTQGIAYDYYTGKPVETTDINGVSNAYAFSDPLERLTTVAKAAGTSMFAYRSVNYVSSTSPAEIGVTDDQTIVGDHLMGTVYYLDGFGRLIQTGVNEPGGSAIATQQGYDGAGRISSYTGPFDVTQQGQQGSTIPVTTYTYL